MLTGTIIQLGNGFGTVEYREEGVKKEAFFHVSTLNTIHFSELKIGQRVQFSLSAPGLIEEMLIP